MEKQNYRKNHNKDAVVWLQITAGQGPKECAWVVAQLSQFLLQEAVRLKISAERVEVLAFDKHLRKQGLIEPDTYLSVLLRLEGEGVKDFADYWEGSIKWQGESPYRPKHKRCNWFVGVTQLVLPLDANKSICVLNSEVEFESMRSNGPGGQHVNKTNSAIRLKHRPSGLIVRVDSDRSQHRNKKIAMERLQLLLMDHKDSEYKNVEQQRWLQHYQVKRGSPKHTFYGAQFLLAT